MSNQMHPINRIGISISMQFTKAIQRRDAKTQRRREKIYYPLCISASSRLCVEILIKNRSPLNLMHVPAYPVVL